MRALLNRTAKSVRAHRLLALLGVLVALVTAGAFLAGGIASGGRGGDAAKAGGAWAVSTPAAAAQAPHGVDGTSTTGGGPAGATGTAGANGASRGSAAGGSSGAAQQVGGQSQSGAPFTISGGLAGTLMPGSSGPLALTLANPGHAPLVVIALGVTAQPGSTKRGCDGPANLQITQSNVSAANPLKLAGLGHVTLPSGSVSAPRVLMRDLASNQDACKGATFTFQYSGSARP